MGATRTIRSRVDDWLGAAPSHADCDPVGGLVGAVSVGHLLRMDDDALPLRGIFQIHSRRSATPWLSAIAWAGFGYRGITVSCLSRRLVGSRGLHRIVFRCPGDGHGAGLAGGARSGCLDPGHANVGNGVPSAA